MYARVMQWHVVHAAQPSPMVAAILLCVLPRPLLLLVCVGHDDAHGARGDAEGQAVPPE